MRRRHGYLAAIAIRRGVAVEEQLGTGQRAVGVAGVRHQAQCGDVGVVPQAAFEMRRNFGEWADLDFFGAHHAPAAFGLDTTHCGQ